MRWPSCDFDVLRDAGIGVAEEGRRRLFDVFHRGANVARIPGSGFVVTLPDAWIQNVPDPTPAAAVEDRSRRLGGVPRGRPARSQTVADRLDAAARAGVRETMASLREAAARGFVAIALFCSAGAVRAITLTDPVSYQVKNTWDAVALGVPANLGGLLFSADGGTLYAVGASEGSDSALYAIPVTRDPSTHGVTDLGPPASVVKVFDGNPSTPGLDAGIDFGPAGTLFYTYWSSNRLGERPGGFGGTETQFDMGAVGVPSSIAGLAFSPHLTDAGTGHGLMQISSWQGANLYDIPLTPAGGGLFTPGIAQLFVTLPRQGTGAIQYVPSGPLAGDVMYVNWNYGEVRVLTIDHASGLAIDQNTMVPTRGTATPVDEVFASDLGVGPWGLEFDPLTNDFFVGTWGGNPANSIIQIGGFPAPPPTTTTTMPSSTTTTTTLPAGNCTGIPDGPTFASVICRLQALLARVNAEPALGSFQPKLAHALGKGHDRAVQARGYCAEGNAKRARSQLKKVVRAVIQYAHRLSGLSARRKVPPALRQELLAPTAALRDHTRGLRRSPSCPADALGA